MYDRTKNELISKRQLGVEVIIMVYWDKPRALGMLMYGKGIGLDLAFKTPGGLISFCNHNGT